MIAVYPGSFDPVTLGHLDIIERAAKIADKLYVGVLINVSKAARFTAETRLAHLRELTAHLPNVEVAFFDGMLVEFVKKVGADVIIRGFRFEISEYEMQMVTANIIFGAETFFIPAKPEFSYISSSLVKEIAARGGDISGMVPEIIGRAFSDGIGS